MRRFMRFFKEGDNVSMVLIKRAAYNERLKPIIHNMMDNLTKDVIFPGATVLLKPNLLVPSTPEQGIITHPLVVRSVAEYAIDHGAKVQVSDSPAMGSFNKAIKTGRYIDTCKGLDITWKPFSETRKVDVGPPFGRIDIARDAMESDIVINLAKLKTHVQMQLTLGVKNMFGCIVGYEKPRWHYRAGIDRNLFARLIVQICRATAPVVTLVDGILALEGRGPGKSGTPRQLNIIVGGKSPYAVDEVIAKALRCPLDTLPIHQAALSLGLVDTSPQVSGDKPVVDQFDLPTLGPIAFGPPLLQKFMRRHLIIRPAAEPEICQCCGLCEKQCPAAAISINKKQVMFDYDACIRCYCCVEICPYGALYPSETILTNGYRLLKKGLQQIPLNRLNRH